MGLGGPVAGKITEITAEPVAGGVAVTVSVSDVGRDTGATVFSPHLPYRVDLFSPMLLALLRADSLA